MGTATGYSIPSYFTSQGRMRIIARALLVCVTMVALAIIVLLLPWIVEVVGVVIPGGSS